MNQLNVEATAQLERMQYDDGKGPILFASTLQAAAMSKSSEMIRLLLKNRVRNIHGGFYGDALQAACIAGRESNVAFMIESQQEYPVFDVNSQGGHYGNALQAAAFNGNTNVIGRLLKAKAEVNARGGRFGHALIAAIYAKNPAAVDVLLKHGADPNVRSHRYGTALQVAIQSKSQRILGALLFAGANSSGKQIENRHLLHHAARHGNMEMAKAILEHDLEYDLEIRERTEGYPPHTALQVAASCCQPDVTRLLLRAGASWDLPEKEQHSVAALAVKKSGAPTVKEVLQHIRSTCGKDFAKALVNKGDPDNGQTLLRKAVERNLLDVVMVLLDYGADMTPDKQSFTPLHTAAWKNHHEIMHHFLNLGATRMEEAGITAALDIQSHNGRVPLFEVSWHNSIECARLLIAHGNLRFVGDERHQDPLHATAMRNSHTIIRLFFNMSQQQKTDSNFNPFARNCRGESALMLASVHNHVEAVRALLDHECTFEGPNLEGVAPLHTVARNSLTNIAKLMLDLSPERKRTQKFDINVRNSKRKTPLMDACEKNHYTISDLFLRHGADYKLQDQDGWSALHYCAHRNYARIVRLILDKAKANGNVHEALEIEGGTPSGRRTVLRDLCWIQNAFESLKIVLEYGPKCAAVNPHNKWTALHEAAYHNLGRIARELITHVYNSSLADKRKAVLDFIDARDSNGNTAARLAEDSEFGETAQIIKDLRAILERR